MHKLAEEHSSHFRNLMHYIISNARSAIAVHDRDLKYIYVSDRYLREFNVREKDVIGRHHYEVFPDLPQKWRDVHQRTLKGEVVSADDDAFHRADGTVVWTRWECRPWYEPDGSVGGIIIYTEVISEWKEREQQLRESEEKYRSLIEQSSEMHYLHDLGGNIIEVNQEACIATGYTKQEIERMNVFDLHVDSSRKEEILKAWQSWQSGGQAVTLETIHLRKDGTELPVELSARKISFGGNDYILALARDMSKRKVLENLINARLRLAEISRENSIDHLLNKTLEEAETLTGSKVSFYHFIDLEGDQVKLQQWSNNTEKNFCRIEERYRRHYPLSSAGVWVDCVRKRAPVIHNDFSSVTGRKGMPEGHVKLERQLTVPVIRDNSIIAVLGVGNKPHDYTRTDVDIINQLAGQAWDIAEKKRAVEELGESEKMLKRQNEEYAALNEELIESNERIKAINRELLSARKKAEESDRLKTAFLANMSHEIRTPMNAIIGFSEMLLKQEIEKEKKESFAKIINGSCQQLLRLVDDIIDIARIETGQLELHEGKTDLNQMISGIAGIFAPEAEQKGVAMNVETGLPAERAEIIADSSKVNQILTNLVSNAVKFTEKGSIDIGYRLRNGHIEFFVNDTGPGIGPQYHKVIFDRFRQVDTDPARKHRGAGLGLAISKAIAELMDGNITVESEPGKGSSFTFTIPHRPAVQKVAGPQIKKQRIVSFKGLTILIAEDEETNFLFLEELLNETGVNILRARNGLEAFGLAVENDSVSLILMDIKMPVMDGVEATLRIKEVKPNLPVIALTAYAMAGDREKCLNAGCDGYLSKPVMKAELFSEISARTQTV
jgi:PAS domain S-box-containing protein